ncbi:MAG TPA: hypothetical protein VHA73_06595 [Acidimicrobiales bacterium]|nr:hypothetical protein [Acidimicrobiales bacterium]
MPPRDPRLSRAAGAWVVEVARNAAGLAGAYGPWPVISRRRLQAALVAFADAASAPRVAWAHRQWAEAMGQPRGDDATRAVVQFAATAGEHGRPSAPQSLADAIAPPVVRAVRAAVGVTAVTAIADQALADLERQVRGAVPRSLGRAATDVVAATALWPLAVPFAGWALAGWALARSAPPLPVVEIDEHGASLFAHLVAEALPEFLSGAAIRMAVARSPFAVSVAMCPAGGDGVTVRAGRGHLSVIDGVADDAMVVVDGPLDELLERAGDALVAELAHHPLQEGPSR